MLALGVRVAPLAVLPIVSQATREIGECVIFRGSKRLNDGTIAIVFARLFRLATKIGEVLCYFDCPGNVRKLHGFVNYVGAEEDRMAVVLIEALWWSVTFAVLVSAFDAEHRGCAGEHPEDCCACAVDEL